MYNFEPYNVLLVIATNIPVLLMTASVLQGHIWAFRSKNKSLSRQVPSFSPLSEYAPPPNPSADHLIASNPFDDNYSSSSLRPANPYLGLSHYPGFSGYGMPSRDSGLYRTPHHMQNQPHLFSQNPMGFNRSPGFNYSENPNYGQPFSSSSSNNVMHFRPSPGERVHNLNQRASPRGPVFSPARDVIPNLSQHQNNFTQSSTPTPKQHPSETVNCEENKTRTKSGAERLNGILHANNEALKKSADACSNGALTDNEGVNRRSTSSSSEPVYPCGICPSEVNDDQEAILCEASCQKWFHRVCTGMTETAYSLLTAEASAVWGCDACMEDRGAPLLKTIMSGTDPIALFELHWVPAGSLCFCSPWMLLYW